MTTSASVSRLLFQCRSTSFHSFGSCNSEKSNALFRPLTFSIDSSQKWAVIGSHSSQFLDATILGRSRAFPTTSRSWPSLGNKLLDDRIKKIAFNTRLANRDPEAQQGAFEDHTRRYFGIREEDRVTLKKYLHGEEEVARKLHLEHLWDLPLITLSNGQTRRARIARGLISKPDILILNEPFTGLDVESRSILSNLLIDLHTRSSPSIIMSLRFASEMPEWIDNVIHVEDDVSYIGPRSEWTPPREKQLATTKRKEQAVGEPVVDLKDVNVKYGERSVLKDINWTIRKGEHWILAGDNGSGKSTLLAMITGDHPSSYTQTVTLFSKLRSEQSSYHLTRSIGVVSPEINNAFPRRHGDAALSGREVVATGFDGVFCYRAASVEQRARVEELMDAFPDAQKVKDTAFVECTEAQQALLLFLRAVVSKAPLLLLDEPFAGMTKGMIEQCREYLDESESAWIMISHWRQEWPSSASHVFKLEKGNGSITEI